MSETVSRETQDRLNRYAALLVKWQSKINLVAPETLPEAAIRHFQDSLQLLPLLGKGPQILIDLGTGAGFPGLVLAIARPDLEVHLVESDAKKCEFLKTVSRETQTPVTIHTTRIEAAAPFRADMITARALASLEKLVTYAKPFIALNPDIRLIFLKGENWAEEVTAARKIFNFDLEHFPSQTHPKSQILVLTNIHPLT